MGVGMRSEVVVCPICSSTVKRTHHAQATCGEPACLRRHRTDTEIRRKKRLKEEARRGVRGEYPTAYYGADDLGREQIVKSLRRNLKRFHTVTDVMLATAIETECTVAQVFSVWKSS